MKKAAILWTVIGQASNESFIMDNSVFDIAPRENKEIKSVLLDGNCEELVFPFLFPRGKFGKPQKKLGWSKYINQRLLVFFLSNNFTTKKSGRASMF